MCDYILKFPTHFFLAQTHHQQAKANRDIQRKFQGFIFSREPLKDTHVVAWICLERRSSQQSNAKCDRSDWYEGHSYYH
jgi:hypothetical protein